MNIKLCPVTYRFFFNSERKHNLTQSFFLRDVNINYKNNYLIQRGQCNLLKTVLKTTESEKENGYRMAEVYQPLTS